MKCFSYIFLSLLLFFYTSCSTEPNGNDKPPAGYQEDVPWPSLADSPWPMYRGDPQNTGRSKGFGPQIGFIDWSLDTLNISTGVALGIDSTIYFGVTGYAGKNYSALVAVNQNGSIKWQYELSPYNTWLSSPIVSSENIIYISDHMANKFHAVKSNGLTHWQVDLDSRISQTGINIGTDGTIYVVGLTNNIWTLYAISNQGKILWSIDNLDIAGDEFNGMSFSTDGMTLYIPGNNDGPGLIALNIETKSIEWEFGFTRLTLSGSPIVDSQGNIYVISSDENDNGYLYSLDEEKNIRWFYSLGSFSGWVCNFNLFALDKFGNIYLGLDDIISLDYEGQLRWNFEASNISSPIIIDNSNKIYFTDKLGAEKELICLDIDGNLVFHLSYPEDNLYSGFSPGLGYEKLFIPGYQTSLICSIK